jgi:hypothetical protein
MDGGYLWWQRQGNGLKGGGTKQCRGNNEVMTAKIDGICDLKFDSYFVYV